MGLNWPKASGALLPINNNNTIRNVKREKNDSVNIITGS